MKRLKKLCVLVIAVAGLSIAASPAMAGQGGDPGTESCGVGKALAKDALEDEATPGATEIARVHPGECRGKDH